MILSRPCDNCQEDYDADSRYLKRGQGKFCSRSCSAEFLGAARRVVHQPNTTCSWCQVDFYRKLSSKNSKSGLYYCSSEHQNLAVTNGQYHVGPIGPDKLICLCGKTYRGSLGECRNCYLTNRIERWLKGDNRVTLLISSKTGNPTDTKGFVKRYLIETRGDKCEKCGFQQHGPNGSIIQMDHVNGNCFDNRLENLKLLCPNCHAMTLTYGSRNKGSGRAHRRK